MKIGNVYKMLKVVSDSFYQRGIERVICKCECGSIKVYTTLSISNGRISNCGCTDLRGKTNSKGLIYSINTGDTYHYLTVISDPLIRYINKQKVVYYTCLCKCGNTKDILATNLTTGRILSCGCYATERLKGRRIFDKEGDRINTYTLLECTKRGKVRTADFWKVRCDCGNEKELSVSTLLANKVCTCKDSYKKYLKTYGELTVTDVFYADRNRYAICLCSCGREEIIRLSRIANGSTTACGGNKHKVQEEI